jgi:hypothetical protein
MSFGEFSVQLYNNAVVICRLCRQRKAKRACPALGEDICAVCCGTKRLTEIVCPPTCVYLAAAREHPAASVVRQQQRDTALLVRAAGDFSKRQVELLLLMMTFVGTYQPPEFQRLLDEDVGDAARALGATFETAGRGVIYEHRPQSAPAERLVTALKPLLAEAGRNGGTSFDRDAAIVLRTIGETIDATRKLEPDNHRAFIDWAGRVLRERQSEADRPRQIVEVPRLIVP